MTWDRADLECRVRQHLVWLFCLPPVCVAVSTALGWIFQVEWLKNPFPVVVVAIILTLFVIVIRSALLIDELCKEQQHSLDTISVLHEQLSEARNEAVLSARVKTEFLTNMSHENRTPMNAVIGCADMLYRTNLDPQQRRFC